MEVRLAALFASVTLLLAACSPESVTGPGVQELATEPQVGSLTQIAALETGGAALTPGAQVIYSNLGPSDGWSNANGWSGPSLCTPTDCPGSPGALSRALSFVAPADFTLTDLELAVSDIGDPFDQRPGQVAFDVGIYSNSSASGLDEPNTLLGSASTTAPENRSCTPSTDPTCLPFGLTPLLTLTTVTFSTPIPLTGGQRYWIGLHPSNSQDKIDIAWWWNYLEGAVQSRHWTTGGGGAVNFSEVQLDGSWTSNQVLIESAFRVSGIPATFSCGSVIEIPTSECEALVAVYNSTDGENWTNNAGWLLTDTPCSWHGVNCAGGAVTGLNINSNNLTGNLPPELVDLTSLTLLQLRNNAMSGSIPAFLGNITSLYVLRIDNNNFTGTIPLALGNLTSLNTLGLSFNDLTGSIPPGLASIPTLYYVVLAENRLSGSIPPEFGGATGMGLLDLSGNELSGTIPLALGNLVSLFKLELQENQLNGVVPLGVAQVGAAAVSGCYFSPNTALYMPATPDYQALGDPICGIALTPLEDVANEVTEQISDLVTSGEVNSGLGNALIKQINKALEKLNEGKTAPAVNMLNDLIAQIGELIADGQISAAEGENLIALATALLP